MDQFFVWTFSDVVGLSALALTALVWLAITIKTSIKRAVCKHDGDVIETSACNAICLKCGKNLGFIGAWRDKSKSA